jgi:thioesterase domain-containing protein
MAQEFLLQIKNIQKVGPYYLGGFCLGGLVAYEMAQQLIKNGERVNLLFMINTRTAKNLKDSLSKTTVINRVVSQIFERIELEKDNLSYLSWENKLKYLKEKYFRCNHIVKVRSEELIKNILLWAGSKTISFSKEYIVQKSVDNSNTAYLNYSPKNIETNVVIFRAARHPRFLNSEDSLGWSSLVRGNIKMFEHFCFHKNIMKEPHVRFVGEKLRDLLVEIDGKQE